jgi:hypothetical protein
MGQRVPARPRSRARPRATQRPMFGHFVVFPGSRRGCRTTCTPPPRLYWRCSTGSIRPSRPTRRDRTWRGCRGCHRYARTDWGKTSSRSTSPELALRRCLIVLTAAAPWHSAAATTLFGLLQAHPALVTRASAAVVQLVIDRAPEAVAASVEQALPRYSPELLRVMLARQLLEALPADATAAAAGWLRPRAGGVPARPRLGVVVIRVAPCRRSARSRRGSRRNQGSNRNLSLARWDASHCLHKLSAGHASNTRRCARRARASRRSGRTPRHTRSERAG